MRELFSYSQSQTERMSPERKTSGPAQCARSRLCEPGRSGNWAPPPLRQGSPGKPLNLMSHGVKFYRSEVLLLMVETEGVEPLHPGQGQHPRHVLRVDLNLFYSIQVSCQTLIFSSFTHFPGSPVVLPHEGTAADIVPQSANRHCRPQVPGQYELII